MSFRSLIVAGLSLALVPTVHVFAQESIQQQPNVENSKYQFEGAINAASVYVRSGPGDNYYATEKLDKGANVTVVGIKFDWLKIVPPPDSFCYVAKAFIEKRGEGNVGRVTKADVNVRAGSLTNAMKTTVQTHLGIGDDVQIVGEQDEYFKIKPPQGAYLYVNKQFVDMVRSLASTGDSGAATRPSDGTTPDATPVATGTGDATPPVQSGRGTINPAPSIDGDVTTTVNPTTKPSDTLVATSQPTTMPTVAVAEPSVEERFAALESEFSAMSAKPLEDQPAADLGAKYDGIAKADGLSDTLKRVVQFRIATLKAREASKEKLIEARKIEKENAEKQLALAAEHDELQERLKQTDVQIYAAVGTLQASSLQLGTGGTLYRLTDPATGRTVIYIRSDDAKITSFIGQFVGVRGDTTTDSQMNLKMIVPTAIEAVDPAKVNGAVAAQLLPPSMLAKVSSIGN